MHTSNELTELRSDAFSGAPPAERESERKAIKPDPTALIGGAAMMAVGLFFAYGAFNHNIGSASRMGPGFFPFALAIATMLVATVLILSGIRSRGAMPRPDYRQMVAVLASVATFGMTIRWLGLVPAAFLTVIVSSLADRESRIVGTLILASVVSGGIWAVFVLALKLPIPAFRGF